MGVTKSTKSSSKSSWLGRHKPRFEALLGGALRISNLISFVVPGPTEFELWFKYKTITRNIKKLEECGRPHIFERTPPSGQLILSDATGRVTPPPAWTPPGWPGRRKILKQVGDKQTGDGRMVLTSDIYIIIYTPPSYST